MWDYWIVSLSPYSTSKYSNPSWLTITIPIVKPITIRLNIIKMSKWSFHWNFSTDQWMKSNLWVNYIFIFIYKLSNHLLSIIQINNLYFRCRWYVLVNYCKGYFLNTITIYIIDEKSIIVSKYINIESTHSVHCIITL